MIMVRAFSADTLKISPLGKRDRLPVPARIEIGKDNEGWLVTPGLFPQRINLGTIPEGFKLESKDKYEIIFKTKTPPKRSNKKFRK